MGVSQHRRRALTGLGFAVLTVSDTRTESDDISGALCAELLESEGHQVARRLIVPDEIVAIREAVSSCLAHPPVDCVLLTGGTGFTPRDVTVEAVTPLFDRPIEGFGELFRMLSYRQVGAASMLSRATAGLVGGRAIFALPGSSKAVELAVKELVLPEIGHLLGLARQQEAR